MKSVTSRQNIKLGALFGGAAAVTAVLSAIPYLGFLFQGLGSLISFLGGYVSTSIRGGNKDDALFATKQAVKTSIVAAPVVALASGVMSVVALLMIPRLQVLGVYYGPTVMDYIFAFISGSVWALIWTVIVYALGGLVAAFFSREQLPPSVTQLIDKVRDFSEK